MAELLSKSLMENALTLLCHSDQYGKIIASMVEPDLYDGVYRSIAARVQEYWRCHKEAPKQHTADLFDKELTNGKGGPIRHTLIAMDVLAQEINPKYVMDNIYRMIRSQKLKQAILKSAEQLESGQEIAIEEVETLWSKLLRSKEANGFNPGLDLSAFEHVLDYVGAQASEFRTGVKELDEANIVPARSEAFLFVAPPSLGKTWWLINLGRRALQQHKKVLHISLELSEEYVLQRYYQTLFAIAKREARTQVTTFIRNEFNNLKGLDREFIKTSLTYSSPYIRDELATSVDHLGSRAYELYVKQFPSRGLSMDGLRSFLDQLENHRHFVPDILLLDYIGICKTDPKNPSVSLGHAFEEFRGICVERKIAGVTAHQVNRDGEKSNKSKRAFIATDWSLIWTADNAVFYSASPAEQSMGLARLSVEKARTEKGNFSVLITQNYTTGQFVLDSVPFDVNYETLRDELFEKFNGASKHADEEEID